MTSTSLATAPAWGSDIEVETISGRSFRVYRDRPRELSTFLQLAERWADRPHIVQGDRVVTFGDLVSDARRKAVVLQEHGVLRGDRVVIVAFNSPEWIVNFWATVTIGAVPVLGNAWWSKDELATALDLVSPRVVLADAKAAQRLGADVPTAPWGVPEVGAPEIQAVEVANADETEESAVIFTSGTSGHPKAVSLAHRSLIAGLQMLLHITRRLPHQVTEDDGAAALHTGPMFHIGGIQTLLRAVIVGDTLVMPAGKFDPSEALDLIERWKITRWSAVPTMVSRVLEQSDLARRDVSSLKALTVGGAPVHGEFLHQIRTGFPSFEPRVATGYGLTENGGQATAASGRDTVSRPGSCGRPLPCVELRIGASEGSQAGEIFVRSPTQMIAYLGGVPSPIDGDGWLSTGDLGHVDEDGHLWITGRSKDMIIRGGENIAPASVERALNALPSVVESAVFGVPDPDLGEEVMAVVTVQGSESRESLTSQLRDAVASFAIPTRWELRSDPLPVNHSGKIDKPLIAREALDEMRELSGDHHE